MCAVIQISLHSALYYSCAPVPGEHPWGQPCSEPVFGLWERHIVTVATWFTNHTISEVYQDISNPSISSYLMAFKNRGERKLRCNIIKLALIHLEWGFYWGVQCICCLLFSPCSQQSVPAFFAASEERVKSSVNTTDAEKIFAVASWKDGEWVPQAAPVKIHALKRNNKACCKGRQCRIAAHLMPLLLAFINPHILFLSPFPQSL